MTDYFAYFDLRPSPTLDAAELKKKFYANSKRFHPDFHTLAAEDAQQEVLEQSTFNNAAYKVLTNEDTRLRHLLEVKGILGQEGSNEVPQDFLMEIMEVNEALMELEFDDDPSTRLKINGLIDGLEKDLEAEVAGLIADYNDEQVTEEELGRLKDYYLKRRYLLRLRDKI